MRILPGVVALVGLLLGAPSGLTQSYPSRPVTVMVPYAAGGNTDVVARLVLEHVSQRSASASWSRTSPALEARPARSGPRAPILTATLFWSGGWGHMAPPSRSIRFLTTIH